MSGTQTNLASSRQAAWFWAAVIMAVVGSVGYQTINYDFVSWDDELNILLNPHLGPPTSQNVQWMFTDVAYMRRYVPFGWLGLSVAYAFSGLSPVAYHSGCVLLHTLNALLLFLFVRWILRRTAPELEGRVGTRCAAFGALFWAIHPLRAETVGWASGMLYSLACAWALLAVLAYCRGQSAVNTASAWRWTAAALYLVSMLTYPITLGLIAAFVGIDALELRRLKLSGRPRIPDWATLFRQKLPFALAAFGTAATTLYARFTAHEFWTHAPTLEEYSLIVRIARGVYTTAWYLWETCWPANLTPLPTQLAAFQPFGASAIASAIVLIGITWLLWQRKRQTGFVLWFCFLVILLPLLGFTEKEFYISDRYTYLPGMAGAIVFAALLARLPARLHVTGSVAAVSLLCALSVWCNHQLHIWRNSATLFARSVALSNDLRLTESTFKRWIDFHGTRGDIDAAKTVLGRALDAGIRPPARSEMIVALAQLEREKSSGFPPLVARMHADLGMSLVHEKRAREADEHFAAALRIAPGFSQARYNQAILAAENGDPHQAMRLLTGAATENDGSITPDALRQGWALLAHAFTLRGETELAAQARQYSNEVAVKSP